MTWVPPWKPGLPKARCVECGVEHVESVLLADGRCITCGPAPALAPGEKLLAGEPVLPGFDDLVT